MKYSVHDYARALDQAIAATANQPVAKKEAVAKHFLGLVRRNNDESLLRKIVFETARLSRKRSESAIGGGIREIIIESARPLQAAQEKMVKQFLKPDDIVRYKVNPELVAGVKIVVNDELQLDGTMKAKLDILF